MSTMTNPLPNVMGNERWTLTEKYWEEKEIETSTSEITTVNFMGMSYSVPVIKKETVREWKEVTSDVFVF